MHWPPDLQQTAERMAEQFPWIKELGIPQPETPSAASPWESLPLITSAVLEKHYYTESNPFSSLSSYNSYKTSGTSSRRRKTIWYSPQDEDAYVRIKLDVYRALLGDRGYRRAMSDMGTGHAEATAVNVFLQLGMEVESVSFRLPIEQHLERLAAFRPEVLYTMPSILERILLASDHPQAYGIRHVILVGEMASPSWIRRVAERLGIGVEQVTDTYGSIEIGTIAYFSPVHGRYVFTEGIFAEGVRAEAIGDGLEPLPEDEQVLVLTSTVREAFPALRYVTYDVVRDLRTIQVDGVPRQSFQSLVKRVGPDLKHGEKISIYDIEDVVCQHVADAGVRVKVAGNALTVCVYSQGASPQLLELIQHDLEHRIPEIGLMIQSGILEGIRVIGGTFDDAEYREAVKHKKIVYE